MSRTIQVDDDVYESLSKLIKDFDDTPSSVLRRLFNSIPREASKSTEKLQNTSTPSAGENIAPSRSLFQPVLGQLERSRNATEKYLCLLSHAYSLDPEGFRKVLALHGTRRRYFGESAEDIELSGQSTHPRRIPRSPYWALTNLDNSHKKAILRESLETLNFPLTDIEIAINSIE